MSAFLGHMILVGRNGARFSSFRFEFHHVLVLWRRIKPSDGIVKVKLKGCGINLRLFFVRDGATCFDPLTAKPSIYSPEIHFHSEFFSSSFYSLIHSCTPECSAFCWSALATFLFQGPDIGHVILDSVAARLGYKLTLNERLDGYISEGETSLNGKPAQLTLFKPRPLMNVLGIAVGKACRATVQSPNSVIVIQDTMHLERGRLKVKYGGNPDGHRGIRSVNKFLHSQDYFRLLAGIGRAGDAREYVLGPLSAFEKEHFSVNGAGTDEAWKCIEDIAERMETLRTN